MPHFECGAFNRSATSPSLCAEPFRPARSGENAHRRRLRSCASRGPVYSRPTHAVNVICGPGLRSGSPRYRHRTGMATRSDREQRIAGVGGPLFRPLCRSRSVAPSTRSDQPARPVPPRSPTQCPAGGLAHLGDLGQSPNILDSVGIGKSEVAIEPVAHVVAVEHIGVMSSTAQGGFAAVPPAGRLLDRSGLNLHKPIMARAFAGPRFVLVSPSGRRIQNEESDRD